MGLFCVAIGRFYFQIVSVSLDQSQVRMEFSEAASRAMVSEDTRFEHDTGSDIDRLASPYSYSSHILFSLSELGIAAGLVGAIAIGTFIVLATCFTWSSTKQKGRG